MGIVYNLPIKQRLTLIIMAISIISVLLTTLSISIIGFYSLREKLINENKTFASIVGDRNSAALIFSDISGAETNLSLFGSARHDLIQACLYSSAGELFSRYGNKEADHNAECPENLINRAIIQNDHVEVMQPVMKGGDKIGYVYIAGTLEQVNDYIEKQTTIAFFVVIAVIVISYLMAVSLQRGISIPILKLADTAKQVSLHKDYTIRAELIGDGEDNQNNELVILTNSFNNMLSEINERNLQLRKQYEELERARDAAESANRAKSQFLANISHELRTPLNAIIGFSSILMNQLFGPLGDEKYLEYARDINNSGTHLLEIINDILDLSKAEAGKLVLNYEEVHVGKAINKCLTIIADRATKGRVTITPDVPKMLPSLMVDRLRFIQILLNIIANAVKFTEEGGNVNIAVSTNEVQGETTEFIITVTDTGIGMSKDDIEHAFQRFGQVDSGLNRKYEGTGLGLPLTQKLMQLHHGKIDIESQVGKGTKVTLTFPAIPPIEV